MNSAHGLAQRYTFARPSSSKFGRSCFEWLPGLGKA
jgi:hypothetical protein